MDYTWGIVVGKTVGEKRVVEQRVVEKRVVEKRVVEKRRERRFKPNQAVVIKVLGLRPGPLVQACILDISASGMRLRSKVPVPCGVPVSIEVNDTVSTGSVFRCDPKEDSYELGIKVSETAPALKA
jgi:hypothetical protein